MRIGPDGRLYVAQAFGSQVSAVDIVTGAVSTISRIGGAIVAPDDLAFDSHGKLYATEVMSERVCVRAAEWRSAHDRRQRAGRQRYHRLSGSPFHGRMPSRRPHVRAFPDGRAPRLIADHLPLPNALSVGPDGFIYFPAIGANEIWRVPLAGGKPERFAGDLAVPTAVKIDSKGSIISTQGRTRRNSQNRFAERRAQRRGNGPSRDSTTSL